MRRSFNKALCVSISPPPDTHRGRPKTQYKTKQRRCNELEILMQDYKDQAGEQFNVKELAFRCGVNVTTTYRWFRGYCPHYVVWWTIARYFEPFTKVTKEIIHEDIRATIEEWSKDETAK